MGIIKAFIIARIMFRGWRTLCAVSSVGLKCAPYIGAACDVGLGAYTIAPHVRLFLAANFPQPRTAALPHADVVNPPEPRARDSFRVPMTRRSHDPVHRGLHESPMDEPAHRADRSTGMKKEEVVVRFRGAFPNSNPWQCHGLLREDVEEWVADQCDDSVELVSLYCDGWMVLHNSYERQETTIIAQWRK